MDITPYFVAVVLVFGLWMLWVTGKRAAFDRKLRIIKKTLGRKAAWEWYLTTPQWEKIRQACFKAFQWRCANCGSPFNLQAHHRTKEAYDHLGHEKPIIDLTALCRDCHAKAPRADGLYALTTPISRSITL